MVGRQPLFNSFLPTKRPLYKGGFFLSAQNNTICLFKVLMNQKRAVKNSHAFRKNDYR